MTSWNDKAYNDTVVAYPTLEAKPESVALAVFMLKQNPAMNPDDWKELSEKTGVRVAGRAIGSAREILGVSSPKKKTAKKAGRKAGKRGRSKNAQASSLSGFLESVKATEKERDRAVATLRKIRDMIDAAV